MTKRKDITPAPEPLEAYVSQFDDVFSKSNQREAFRRYLEGLLLPTERHKTLTGLVNTEPVVGAQLPRAQKLQWFLSESTWNERQVQAQRLRLLRENPATAPDTQGVLVIDETGDRKDGHKTAHVARQYLGNVGKIDNGVVSVTSLWAEEQVYYPLDFEPYTPESYFAQGKNDPAFHTKPHLALQLIQQARGLAWPWRAVVADSLYGEDRGLRTGLRQLQVPYVMALKPSHAWWHLEGTAGSLQEVIRLYGLRMWVEQSYKQVKHALSWSQYQVRSDQAIRRHWQLVCCAFSFCWYHASPPSPSTPGESHQRPEPCFAKSCWHFNRMDDSCLFISFRSFARSVK